MSHHTVVPVSFSGRSGRNMRACKSPFLFALVCLALNTCVSAFALTPTTTTLTVTSAGSAVTTVAGQSVITLTATVQAGTTPLTVGQVKFCDATVAACTDIHLLGTAQVTSAGTAKVKFIPAVGSHNYKAVFFGTKTYAASSSSNSALTVTSAHTGKYSTNTTITQSGVAGNYTLTATVSAVTDAAESAFPTGTISFLDTPNGNTVLGTADLTSNAGLGFLNTSIVNATGPAPDFKSIGIGDFNGDGIPDMAVVNFGDLNFVIIPQQPTPGWVTILLGNGDGTFTTKSVPQAGYGAESVAVADFNGDGIPDLAVANAQGSLDAGGQIGSVTVLLGNGDGTFTATAASPSTGSNPDQTSFIATGDFNGDGIPDLAVANLGSTTLTILLGNGDGTFTAAASPATGKWPESIAVADFNGDGIADLAVMNTADRTVSILLGDGDGTFSAAASPATGVGPTSMVLGDFNGDGKPDLAVVNSFPIGGDGSQGSVTVLLGNGDGTFTTAASPLTCSEPRSITAGDFNGDGKTDLAVACFGAVTMLSGDGDGTFAAPALAFAVNPTFLATADFNGDGKSDLAAADGGGTTASGYRPSVWTLLAETQTATATATGISPNGTGTHQVAASFPGDGNYSASLSGTIGLTAANIQASLSTTNISFGNQEVLYTTSAQPVTLSNTGTVAMTITSIQLTGADTSSFITSNTCGTSLAAGAKCRIGVRFVPPSTGPFTAAITLTDNAPSSPQTVSLSGTGITAPAASLSLSATNLSFPAVPAGVGDSSAPQAVTVTNTSGSATVYFNSISVGGANPSSFVTSNTCGGIAGGSLAAGATCRIGVRFTPQTGGALSATITLTDSAGASPQTITLSGTGIGALAILSPYGHQFGNEPVGDSSDADSVTLSNNGYLPLEISSIKLTGADASSYATSNNCGVILPVGASCRIGMRFAPVGLGPASANITLTDNAPNSPQTITLNGTGITPPPASLSLSTTSLAFGNETVGLSTVAQGVIVTNTSTTTALYFKTITLGGANASSFVTSNTCNGEAGNGVGGSLAPGAQCRIGARFAPKAAGPLTATITLTDSATGSPQTITLTGTGQ